MLQPAIQLALLIRLEHSELAWKLCLVERKEVSLGEHLAGDGSQQADPRVLLRISTACCDKSVLSF